jgi:Zn ribbon nucleic-acid-binding protein
MMGIWRVMSLLALTAFWAQSPSQTSTKVPAATQNSAPTSEASTAQNGIPRTGSTTAQDAAPATPQGIAQPVPFSHKQHAGTLKLPCEFCHTASRSGETVAIPRASFCMQCHQTMDTNNPGVQKLATYAKSNAVIPWVRVYQLPSFVSFSHKTHLLHGATCRQCHGPVEERTQLYTETDISMAGCVNCHRTSKASTGCDTCHSLEQ